MANFYEKRLPDGTKICVANLDTISLRDLESGDAEEIHKLSSVMTSQGIFYIDFHGSQMGTILSEKLGEIYYVTQEYFDQSHDMKVKDFRADQKHSQDRGYKFCSTDETFEMAYDELVKGDLALPPILHQSKYSLKYFSEICHNTALSILRALSNTISTGEPLTRYHMKSGTSDSGLKLVYEPFITDKSQVCDNTHTDSGILTLLFYDEWGLEVQLQDGKWAYVAPVSGCAVVNVADYLEGISDNRFRSVLHRVTQPVDGFAKRYFLSYFLRPVGKILSESS
ncbi:hypothetical protein H072_6855 [Dactylellina haptotyla CBS 200.50]|uniref:Fe2OG dioxygenase domain-containing protein n=1 Tax=Dactylellina haptotyla (strain CBS 200.50) TaxID=1284197 RepID=S8A8Q9_DACHA|nr:hypothetical protein H072_6855 [Dactylellina haptotyla CBS 200.50]